VFAFISRVGWDGTPGDWEKCKDIAEVEGAEVIVGDWTDESTHRKEAQEVLREKGHQYVLIPDGDEVIEPRLLDAVLGIAKGKLAERVNVFMDTYWKSPEYVIRPREQLTPAILIDLTQVQHNYIRDYRGGRCLILEPGYGVLHHLSYAGPEERIKRKIKTWSHKHELIEHWYPNVYLAWDDDHGLRDLHPTHPQAYGSAERIPIPEVLKDAWNEGPSATDPDVPKNWPTVSVIIPLYGGEEDIRLCLDSLEKCGDLLHEIIIVDDCSPDDAPSVVKEFAKEKNPTITFLQNEKNSGFAATCNRGYEVSTGEAVIFLNSDTITPRAGLIRLVESLISSPTIGASGPHSNNVGYQQPIDVTYTDIANIDLFARDFAYREADDQDLPILVGFCLAVKRTVLQEIGTFDERFGRGMFEDNDFCYRIQRAGYRLRLAARSFVHHSGSHSLARMDINPNVLLSQNMDIYHAKWREEIDSGYASHLPGQKAEVVTFRPDRHPDAVRKRIAKLAKKANISLCMIAKDEESVIGDCLRSTQGVFTQTTLVDTGSSDRTKEIALGLGAELHDFPWTQSFSEARNESLKYAKGDWIFWLDADDTLPVSTAELILQAAINAPRDVVAFVVPVQFVGGDGTRVDHVKLFRNQPEIRFEFHIHEQILPSLRKVGGRVERLEAVVMHTNYDTSVEGQERKCLRDKPMLLKDLAERPEHPFVLFNLGMTAHYTNEHEEAIDFLTRCIVASTPIESHVRKTYALLGVSKRELGDHEAAMADYREGLQAVGEDPELRFQLGLSLTTTGKIAEAKEQYLLVDPRSPDFFSSVDLAIMTYKRFYNLGMLCLTMDQYAEAREWLLASGLGSTGPVSAGAQHLKLAMYHATSRAQTNARLAEIARAIEQDQTLSWSAFSPAAIELFKAALSRYDFGTAKAALDAVKTTMGPSEEWATLGANFAAATGQSTDAFLWEAARMYSYAIGPRLVLARRLLEAGMEAEAATHLAMLDEMGCAEGAFFRSICATRRGDLEAARSHMRRACDLNPASEQSRQQLEALEKALQA
jgi:GT2 family glycosyltransferase/tetratricopeptide (TPR) repeat protein